MSLLAKVDAMRARSLPWSKVDDMAIKRGNQIISKNYSDGCTLFVLWNGEERIGHYESADDARAIADQLRGKSHD